MALYDLTKEFRLQQFLKRVKSLVKNKRFVKLEEQTDKTLSQMALVHVWFKCLAVYAGYSTSHVKQHIFKQQINPDIFLVESVNTETGEIYKEVMSMSDKRMTKEKLSLAMSRFNNECGKIDLRLPLPDDKMYIREIREAEEKAKIFTK